MAAQHKFSERSLSRLLAVDTRLATCVKVALKSVPFDVTVLCGHRTEEQQDEAVRLGRSKVRFPRSKHNSLPSKAVDIAPYPVDWNDLNRFALLAGAMYAAAYDRGLKIRWGGNFDRDADIYEQRFIDAPHFEVDE